MPRGGKPCKTDKNYINITKNLTTMKKRSFLMTAASVLLVAMAAVGCSKDKGTDGTGPDDNTGGDDYDYTLIANQLTVNFGWNDPAPVEFRVTTNSPDGWVVGETPDWYDAEKSGNMLKLTAKSNNGDKLTHTLKITAEGAKPLNIIVNQSAKGEVPESLTGSAYYVFQLDNISSEYLGDKIIEHFYEDGTGIRRIDVWNAGETLSGYEGIGPSFYGYQTGWMAYTVEAPDGWSGGGYAWDGMKEGLDPQVPIDWSPLTDDAGEGWYFHAAIKGTPGADLEFRLSSSAGEASTYHLKYKDTEGVSTTDWTEVEVSIADLMDKGWAPATEGYILSFHGTGKKGDDFQWDAMFIYKK